MAITKKQCAWPECDKEFYGTERKEYCGNTCKNKQWRINQRKAQYDMMVAGLDNKQTNKE